MSEILSNKDNKYLFSLIKENKMAEAVKFVREKTNMSLKEAKEYVDMKRIDEKEFKNKILNEKIPYKKGYIIDRKLNILILSLSRQRKAKKIILYILLIFIIISPIQLYFLNKTSLEQIFIFIFCISTIFPWLMFWLLLGLNIYITEKKINKIEKL